VIQVQEKRPIPVSSGEGVAFEVEGPKASSDMFHSFPSHSLMLI